MFLNFIIFLELHDFKRRSQKFELSTLKTSLTIKEATVIYDYNLKTCKCRHSPFILLTKLIYQADTSLKIMIEKNILNDVISQHHVRVTKDLSTRRIIN